MNTPKLSRQYRQMIERKKRGLCIICGNKARFIRFRIGSKRRSVYCEPCWIHKRDQAKARATKTWRLDDSKAQA